MAGLLEWLNTPQGVGLLSGVASYAANARRGTPVNNVGRGLAGGLMGYSQANDQINQDNDKQLANQFRQMQMDEMRQKIESQKAIREASSAAYQGAYKPPVAAAPAMTTYATELGSDDPLMGGLNAAMGGDFSASPLMGKQQEVNLPARAAQPGGFDPEAYRQQMFGKLAESGYVDEAMKFKPEKVKPVALGKTLVNPETGETIAVDSTWKDDQVAQREQRNQELEMRLEDQRLSREQSAALRRELAANNDALRRDLMVHGNKPPAGYRYTANGSLEAIPGGPADIKAGEAGAKDAARKEFALAQSQNVLDAITDAKKLVGPTTAGFGGTLRNLPMSGARDLDAKITTIKANLGFDRLQQMRDTSPTGGALGQVAVQELTALQATVASLDQLQSPAELNKALGKIETHYRNWQNTLKGEQPSAPSLGKQAAPARPKPGTIKDGYQFLGGDPANPKMWAKVKR